MGMLRSCLQSFNSVLRDICCCHVKFDDRSNEDECRISYNVSTSIKKKDSSNSNPSQIYLNIRSSPRLLKNRCFGFRWYFNRPPLSIFRPVSSNMSRSQRGGKQKILTRRRHSWTQPTNILRSMRWTSSVWSDQSDVHPARREGQDLTASLNYLL